MKTIKLAMLLIAFSAPIALAAQSASPAPAVQQQQKDKKSETAVFTVKEMHGDHCKMRIEKSVGFEKGVKKLTVNLKAETVTITYDPKKTTTEILQKKLAALGYPTTLQPQSSK